MKVKALQNLRQKLKKNEPIYGLWVTLESASITEMAVALGLDWVVIDPLIEKQSAYIGTLTASRTSGSDS